MQYTMCSTQHAVHRQAAQKHAVHKHAVHKHAVQHTAQKHAVQHAVHNTHSIYKQHRNMQCTIVQHTKMQFKMQQSNMQCNMQQSNMQVACPSGCQDEVYCSQHCATAAWAAHHSLLCCQATCPRCCFMLHL
jgi:aspartate oxidase